METQVNNQIVKPVKRRKKVVKGVVVSSCTLLSIYSGMTIYFMNHLYFGTEINGINVSGKAVEAVNQQMASELQTYTLNLKERGNKSEQIKADEIGLTYNSGGDFKSFKDKQNPYNWISSLFDTSSYKMTEGIKYDEEKLKERLDKLSCLDSNNIIEPKSASLQYADNKYVVVDEITGNKIDKDILYKYVSEAVMNKKTEIDLEAIDCYVKPQYTSKSQKLIEAKDSLNKYLSSKITYIFGERKEVLDSPKINDWLKVDDNFNVTFDEAKAKEYVDKLAQTYNTTGRTRNFATSSGNTINIGGGDYGWTINKAKETEMLIAAIKEGQTIEKQPAYSQTAAAYGGNDIGNAYVEIDMSRQHLWFYKNGALITQGDIVTGNISANNGTPAGIYKLKYKEKNATLDGADYSVPVSYWMPFNKNIGIHDATWRSLFGGSIYKTGGSHGCVNAPLNLAKTIFENIEAGTPVVCYY